MKDPFPKSIPDPTRAAVEPLLSETNIYRLIGQHGDEIITDDDFVPLYVSIHLCKSSPLNPLSRRLESPCMARGLSSSIVSGLRSPSPCNGEGVGG